MQSTNSSSNNLRNHAFDTIVRENLHRYWPVPVLSILSYLLFCLLPILMNYRDFRVVNTYAENMMKGASFVVLFVATVTAIIASAAVFGYLHDPVSATAVHAMPIDRKRLFSASAYSGWLFVVVPVAVLMLLLLLMRGATFGPSFQYGYSGPTAKEIFTLSHALTGCLSYIVVATCVYAVCCFAAVLSGKRGIHVLFSMFLIALPNFFILIVQSLCSTFLYGFTGFNINNNLISPLTYALWKSTYGLDLAYLVYYVGWTVLLLLVSYLIYRAVRLERIGSACTFPVVADILCILLTFLSAIGLSEIIVALTSPDASNARVRMLITSFVTSVICYLIMRMIADSTPAVFHLGTVKKFLVYLVILAVVLAFTVLDVAHFQTRVPDPAKVQSVTVQTDYPGTLIEGDREFSDAETVAAVAGLQQALVDTRNASTDEINGVNSVVLTWHLANGRTMRRTYSVYWSPKHKEVEQALEQLYSCDEFKAAMQIDADTLLADTKILSVYGNPMYGQDQYYSYSGDEETVVRIRVEDWEGLLEAMNKDIAARTFAQAKATQDEEYLCQVTLARVPQPVETANGVFEAIELDDDEFVYTGFNMYDFDQNTQAFLKEKGYYDRIVKP